MATTRLIFVEGLIGCGKTTCLKNLEEHLESRNITNVKVIYEPVELWQSLGLLHNFYSDKKRWAYTFQNMAFITKMMLLDDLEPGCTYIIERSPHVDRYVFAELCREENTISEQEWRLYMMWYNHFMLKFQTAFQIEFVYIRASPELCLERAKERSRDEELGIPLEYFSQLETKHDNWLGSCKLPVHCINGTLAKDALCNAVLDIIH